MKRVLKLFAFFLVLYIPLFLLTSYYSKVRHKAEYEMRPADKVFTSKVKKNPSNGDHLVIKKPIILPRQFQ